MSLGGRMLERDTRVALVGIVLGKDDSHYAIPRIGTSTTIRTLTSR